MQTDKIHNMPDISVQTKAQTEVTLERVGMRQMEIPVKVNAFGTSLVLPAKIDAFVSLDRIDARGIHMSRLYRGARDYFANHELNLQSLDEVLNGFLTSHAGLSFESTLKIKFEWPVQRKALKSEEMGWRFYPVVFEALKNETETQYRFAFEVLYSSTCPCSAALARQLVQQQFRSEFGERKLIESNEVWSWLGTEASVNGVAHAQRSRAKIEVALDAGAFDQDLPHPFALIDLVEAALGTPVQAAVKREDEQEFARLNATNLMFCEDAGRRVKAALENIRAVTDYRAEVVHEESLHAHDAVAIAVKGVKGGFRP